MSSEYMLRTRLAILFFTLLSLVVASLSSAEARFAVILRDRARSDYINTADDILDNKFQSIQSEILICAVITAVATGLFAIYGALIMLHQRWLQESNLLVYAAYQIIVAFVIMIMGGYVADHVHGFQTSFERFGDNDNIPYYSIIYYGGVAQAAYASVLVFLSITVVILVFAFDHYEEKRIRVYAAAGEMSAANNNSEKVLSQV